MWATDFVCGCVRSNLPWAHESRFQTSLSICRDRLLKRLGRGCPWKDRAAGRGLDPELVF